MYVYKKDQSHNSVGYNMISKSIVTFSLDILVRLGSFSGINICLYYLKLYVRKIYD